jgi:hypothetical protein
MGTLAVLEKGCWAVHLDVIEKQQKAKKNMRNRILIYLHANLTAHMTITK